MDNCKTLENKILNLCSCKEITFLAAAIIVFYCANDSWEAWDILKYVVVSENVGTEVDCRLIEDFLTKPTCLVNKHKKAGKELVDAVEKLVLFWKENEFLFDSPTRYVASQFIKNKIMLKNDITAELIFLKKKLNTIKEEYN